MLTYNNMKIRLIIFLINITNAHNKVNKLNRIFNRTGRVKVFRRDDSQKATA